MKKTMRQPAIQTMIYNKGKIASETTNKTTMTTKKPRLIQPTKTLR
jgi:hypothetical protein